MAAPVAAAATNRLSHVLAAGLKGNATATATKVVLPPMPPAKGMDNVNNNDDDDIGALADVLDQLDTNDTDGKMSMYTTKNPSAAELYWLAQYRERFERLEVFENANPTNYWKLDEWAALSRAVDEARGFFVQQKRRAWGNRYMNPKPQNRLTKGARGVTYLDNRGRAVQPSEPGA